MTLAKLKQIRNDIHRLNEDIGSEQEKWELKRPGLEFILSEAETLQRRLRSVLQK